MLRDYQQEMLERLEKAWAKHRGVMVQMPTGTGKTHLMAEVVRNASLEMAGKKPANVLIVAHRKELIGQISQTLTTFGITHGLIASGKPIEAAQSVQVASIQTLHCHLEEIEQEFGLVIIDEAHHAQAKTYRELWKRWPQAKLLGLTATPCRLDGTSFTDLFGTLLQSRTIREFIGEGWLSDFEYISVSPDSLAMKRVRSLMKRGVDGDYQTKEMVTVMDIPESIAHLYKTYSQFAHGKKGIVYAIDREHARHISDYYNHHGVRCAMIDAKTPASDRNRIVQGYIQEQIDVLVNVDIFSEGFDCPEVEFIQLARPTLSLSKYLQQVGRGMRISKGKTQVIILDNVGLYQQFGLPTADRDWQRLFLGKEAGKGMQGMERCVILDSESRKKELVNLEMVRVKKAGQKVTGLEIFLQDGRYGVMRNGKITCPARFKKIERLQKDCGFFALGIYWVQNKYHNGHLDKITTVIDRFGRDLQVKLYGEVRWENGFFHGEWVGVHSVLDNYWDPVGNAYYDLYPDFTKVAGVEIANSYEHNSHTVTCRKLRLSTGNVSPRFNEWDMFYNKDIVIARDYLVVKKDKNHAYRISGYMNDCILVESEEQYGYQQIMLDGKKGQYFTRFPKEATRVANHWQLGLQKVRTG